jgi:hypothetical protein
MKSLLLGCLISLCASAFAGDTNVVLLDTHCETNITIAYFNHGIDAGPWNPDAAYNPKRDSLKTGYTNWYNGICFYIQNSTNEVVTKFYDIGIRDGTNVIILNTYSKIVWSTNGLMLPPKFEAQGHGML